MIELSDGGTILNFNPSEFKCKCGKCGLGIEDMDEEFLHDLDWARDEACTPFKINSSIRCADHNKKVGGKANSSHLRGLAVDLACTSDAQRWKMVRGLMKEGFNRIGIAETYIHVDKDLSKNDDRLWVYPARKGR